VINRASSILCFLALKLANRRRYSSDDTWCMDLLFIHIFLIYTLSKLH
jgi:hypothetical protein